MQLNKIEQANWDPIDSILEEARHLRLSEKERTKTAETKATIYLVALTALLPLSATLVSLFNSPQPFKTWQFIVLMVLFFFVMGYLISAVWWTFKTISVSARHQVDVDELVSLSNQEQINVFL